MNIEAERLKYKNNFDLVVVCGGDGTLSYFAGALRDEPLTLAFIPLGTMNLFARALGTPADPDEAANAIANGTPDYIDVGKVNGRLFLHHASFGLHAKLVRQRRNMKHGSRIGKIIAGIKAFFLAIRRPPKLRLALRVDGGSSKPIDATALVFSNNLFGDGHLPFPDDISQGRLGIYTSTSRQWADLIKLGLDVMTGRAAENPQMSVIQAQHVEITCLKRRKRYLRASVDGELVTLNLPVTVEIVARSLHVIFPAPQPVQVDGTPMPTQDTAA